MNSPIINPTLKKNNLYRSLCLFFLLAPFSLTAQTDSLQKPLSVISTTVENFTADPFGNIYLAYASGQIKKLNEQGDSLGVFNLSRKYGMPELVNAAYPLKIIFYYPAYTTLVVSDRFFNLLNTIDLRRSNLFQVKTIAPAYDGDYWAFDQQDARLVKINDAGKITLQTTGFRQLFDDAPNPVTITDHSGLVFLYDPEKGVYVFDYFGTFKTHIPLLHWTDVHAFDKTIYGLYEGRLMSHTLDQPLSMSAPLPIGMTAVKKMVVTPNRLYLLNGGKIYIFPVH